MNENAFEPYPVFETERLKLRPMAKEDTELVFKFNSNLESLKYVARDPWTEMDQAIEKMKIFEDAYKKREAIWWVYHLKSEDKPIGYGGIFNIEKANNKAEIGYGLLPGYSGKGFMTEALGKMVDFGVNKLKLHRIYAIIDPGNIGSEKVIEKFEFKKEGVLKDHFYARKKYFDMGMYALINKNIDW